MYYICIHKHARLEGLGGMLPQEIFLKIRCSEVVSEDISGWKKSHSGYMARGVLYPIFWLAMYACALPAHFNFHKRRYYDWQNSRDSQ